jgi:hypothetical protein
MAPWAPMIDFPVKTDDLGSDRERKLVPILG